MKIDWKRKLTSRKFWTAIAGFVTPLLLKMLMLARLTISGYNWN